MRSFPCCIKVPHTELLGYLISLPISSQPWESIAMDFLLELPNSRTVVIAVDLLSKMSHFVLSCKIPTAEMTAHVVFDHVCKLNVLSSNITSDHRPEFVTHLWQELFRLLDVDLHLSTTCDAQMDGQSEQINDILEQDIGDFHQNNWVQLLPFAEFVYNKSEHKSTQQSPFFFSYSFHPWFYPS